MDLFASTVINCYAVSLPALRPTWSDRQRAQRRLRTFVAVLARRHKRATELGGCQRLMMIRKVPSLTKYWLSFVSDQVSPIIGETVASSSYNDCAIRSEGRDEQASWFSDDTVEIRQRGVDCLEFGSFVDERPHCFSNSRAVYSEIILFEPTG